MDSLHSSPLLLPERPAALQYLDGPDNVLVVSTYQLDDPQQTSNQSRVGSLMFVDESGSVTASCAQSGGVFRFAVCPEGNHLISALTSGSLSVFDLQTTSSTDVSVVPDALLLTVSLQNDQRALTSDSRGSVYVVDLCKGEVASSLVGHILPYTNEPCEVWSAVWHGTGECCLTGGEDSLLKMWDLRCPSKAVHCNSSHSSGVVFLSCESDVHFISGSYDEHIRRFDSRNFKDPILEQKLPGGVWNVQKARERSLVAACMYGGWTIIDSESFSILSEDASLGEFLLYGAAVHPTRPVIASCTFNDSTVRFHQISL